MPASQTVIEFETSRGLSGAILKSLAHRHKVSFFLEKLRKVDVELRPFLINANSRTESLEGILQLPQTIEISIEGVLHFEIPRHVLQSKLKVEDRLFVSPQFCE